MIIDVVSKEDLEAFRLRLLEDIREMIHTQQKAKRWVKTAEVLKLLDMSDVTLQHLRATGKIPFKKLGGICYYDLDEIEKAIKNS